MIFLTVLVLDALHSAFTLFDICTVASLFQPMSHSLPPPPPSPSFSCRQEYRDYCSSMARKIMELKECEHQGKSHRHRHTHTNVMTEIQLVLRSVFLGCSGCPFVVTVFFLHFHISAPWETMTWKTCSIWTPLPVAQTKTLQAKKPRSHWRLGHGRKIMAQARAANFMDDMHYNILVDWNVKSTVVKPLKSGLHKDAKKRPKDKMCHNNAFAMEMLSGLGLPTMMICDM